MDQEQAATSQVAKAAAAAALPKQANTSGSTGGLYDTKTGFVLQKGLWSFTTRVSPHLGAGVSAPFAQVLGNTKVSHTCLSGKPGDGLAKGMVGKQGCKVEITPKSPTSTTTDLTCMVTTLGAEVKQIMHSEMTLQSPTLATAISQSTTEGLGDPLTMDGIQKWEFISQDCGGLAPGASEDQ